MTAEGVPQFADGGQVVADELTSSLGNQTGQCALPASALPSNEDPPTVPTHQSRVNQRLPNEVVPQRELSVKGSTQFMKR